MLRGGCAGNLGGTGGSGSDDAGGGGSSLVELIGPDSMLAKALSVYRQPDNGYPYYPGYGEKS